MLAYFGRPRWFYYDEWSFLSARDLSVDGLFRPHWQHWSTVPVLVYRTLWNVVGLRSYVPYQGLAITLHLTVVVLLRVVMRRAGVSPWTATAFATLLMFFGTGYADILWAFQIGFTAALVFGLAQLRLTDHCGPVDRRDVFGLAAGALALMCSGVAVTMVVVVGCASLLRRGVRVALFNTVPLAAIYALWFWRYQGSYNRPRPNIHQLGAFTWVGLSAALAGIGRIAVVEGTLVLILVVGFALVWRKAGTWASLRESAAVPLSLLGGALLFMTLTAAARAGEYPAERARESRYVYVGVALAVPAIALAVDALVRRWHVLAPAMALLLVVSLVGNLGEFADQRERDARTHAAYRRMMLAIPYDPLARRVPSSLRPERVFATDVTVGWLLEGADSGRIPRPFMTEVEQLDAKLNLALQQGGDWVRKLRVCSPFPKRIETVLEAGDAFYIRNGSVSVYLIADDGRRSDLKLVASRIGERAVAFDGPLHLVIVSYQASLQWCGIDHATPDGDLSAGTR